MTTCNIAEAARLMKVHEETVAQLIREHKLPAAKIGRAWVMLERDVLEYIEQQIRMQTAARMGRPDPGDFQENEMTTNDNFKSSHVGDRERAEEADLQARASSLAQMAGIAFDSESHREMTAVQFYEHVVETIARRQEADRQAKASMLAELDAGAVDSKSELEAGARAFKRAVQKIELHVEQTDVDRAAFDYVGATSVLLEEFRSLSEAGALGFLITVAQYIVDLKSMGEPPGDFPLAGVQHWIERSE